ncbi:MAG: hypothetical protein MJA83_13975, partial [Gammaproteobacteria bacterium]|nr:hypothetical protein [Gammaproteobacteria bacterium]
MKDAKEFQITLLIYILTFLTALTLFFFRSDIVLFLADHLLPTAFLPRSAGTFYPSFTDGRGYAYQLKNVSVLLILTLIAVTFVWLYDLARERYSILQLSFMASWANNLPTIKIGLFATVIMTIVIYAYFSYPPNAFPSNARMHWVDIFYNWKGSNVYA